MKKLAFAMPLMLLSFASLLSLAQHVEAAVLISSDQVLVTPGAPAANSDATVSISDPTFVPTGSVVRWFVDDVEQTNDQNARSLTLRTKGVGEVTTVKVHIGTDQIITATIAPVRVDLIVGANSHVPAFYQGRALPSRGSEISVQALVYGAGAGPFNFVWSVNGKPVPAGVGGSNSLITFRPGLDYEMFVAVDVYDGSGALVAQADTQIPLTKPKILFYEANPLHGLIRQALAPTHQFLKNETTLKGEPYYFGGSERNFDIRWSIDGTRVAGDTDPLALSLKKTAESGTAVVELEITNTADYSEQARTSINLTY